MVLSLLELLLVHLLVETVHLPHLFDLVKVHHETPLVCVVLLDAFSAEHGEMVRAVEVLHPLVVFVTEQTLYTIFIFKVDVPQDVVSLNNLVKNVEVQGQLVDTLNLLYQLTADGATNPVLVMQN